MVDNPCKVQESHLKFYLARSAHCHFVFASLATEVIFISLALLFVLTPFADFILYIVVVVVY